MRNRFAIFVAFIQIILLVAHGFLYWTWTSFGLFPDRSQILGVALGVLSVSFIPSRVVAFRHSNLPARGFSKISSIWLGFFHFFLMAAIGTWIVEGGGRLLGIAVDRRPVAMVLLGLAVAAAFYAMINAAAIRVHRVTVHLPNLPESWRGRAGALISDVHLGHFLGLRFVRRIVALLGRLRPDVVFIAGDLFDGTAVEVDRVMVPWAGLSVPLGSYFITGNHEEFSDTTRYFDAMKQSGIRVLHNEKVTVDRLQIIGVHDHASSDRERFSAALNRVGLDRNVASILLAHRPAFLDIPEKAGVSLQLSGHTHAGQLFPFTAIVSRVWGPFSYGLNRSGDLAVYTSCGVGTWGAPMRMGTKPEIVLIRFE